MSTQPFKVKAVFDYASEHTDDLSFPNGQIITVTEEEDDEWYYGEYKNPDGITRKGMFPRNHVERFEPVTPPRPTRHSRKATESTEPPVPKLEDEPAPEPAAESEEAAPPPQKQEEEVVAEPPLTKRVEEEHAVPEPKQEEAAVLETVTPASKPATVAKDEPAPSKKAPPPVAGKPSSSAFKDRIAAFNKPAAAPLAPLKPGGLGGGSGTGFIKKPYVPPPPSRDAYVPPPREPARVAYHREEDADRPQPPADAGAERASEPPQDGEAEDQPKPTSLKERIALLQKQQLEQAARHAEAAQKKEKPKRPPKKRTDSSQDQNEAVEPNTADAPGGVSRRTTAEAEEDDDSPAEVRAPKKRTKSTGDDVPTAGGRELFSDTNDADQSADPETEDGEHTSHSATTTPILPKKPDLSGVKEGDEAGSAEDGEDIEEEDEEEEDPEIRRRMELRERMAKMSGGMGMAGMFGPPGGLPAMNKKKTKSETEKKPRAESNDSASAAPVAVMALPGMSMPGMHKVKSPPVEESKQLDGEAPDRGDYSDEEHEPAQTRKSEDRSKQQHDGDLEGTTKLATRGAPPPPPQERTLPPPPQNRPVPPPPSESRPVPPVPPVPQSSRPPASPPDSGSDEEDEPAPVAPPRRSGSSRRAPPVPPSRPEEAASPIEKSSPVVPAPPIPASQPRAPPPPPPAAPPSQPRAASEGSESDDEEEVTEYEGDYDTDIAPNASHKDALTAHDKRDSTDDTLTGDETTSRHVKQPSNTAPTSRPPPLPPTSPPRAVPPPPPPAAAPRHPPSETSREARAPPPIPKQLDIEQDDGRGVHNEDVPTPTAEDEDDLYNATPPRRQSSGIVDASPPPHLGAPPLPPPKRSMEARRSTDAPRLSLDQSFIAEDVDLRRSSQWWTQPRVPPPSLQDRNDVTFEVYETSTRQDNRDVISKQVNVLYLDYSTTVITARFAVDDPAKADFQQQHEPPPTRLRQDQLEDAHSRYGPQIAEAAKSKTNSIVGNGTPFALIIEVLGSLQTLPPVGSRAYGALVYANLANATIQQHDEIRTGDIISFRNAKLQGHRGAMSKKYAVEVGKPDHVGIVVDWDGTKKKVQVWEQGRESKKVKIESFKLGDLRSGEVKVWRAMPRSWVGWSNR